MCEGKTLVPILCMHRSGSSLATNVLAELGMSLGPFTMLSAAPDNPRGFFEAHEFCNLNQAVQDRAFGFSGDMPRTPETLQRFVESEGCWPAFDVPPEWLDRGRELVQRLVASGDVSGFKDPRVPLVWPFWAEVLRRIPGLRVVPVVLLRSPHEIAMSIFMRSKGWFDYGDALDATAVHYRRIAAILADWSGPLARVRFLPEYFREDLRAACRLLGLAWSDEVYSRIFDAESKHHEAAAVAHPRRRFSNNWRHCRRGSPRQRMRPALRRTPCVANASCGRDSSRPTSGGTRPRCNWPRAGPHWSLRKPTCPTRGTNSPSPPPRPIGWQPSSTWSEVRGFGGCATRW